MNDASFFSWVARTRRIASSSHSDKPDNMFSNLVDYYKNFGKFATAIELHEKHLVTVERLGGYAGRAYLGLGECYRLLGHYTKAITIHKKHLAIAKELGDRAGQGRVHGNMGLCYRMLGQYDKAIKFHNLCLATADDIDLERGRTYNPKKQFSSSSLRLLAYRGLGLCYYSTREYDTAIELHKKHLKIAKEVGDRLEQGRAYGNMGLCFEKLREYDKAIILLKKDLGIAKDVGDLMGQGGALCGLGMCYQSLGKYDKAIELHAQQLTIVKEVGDRAGQGRAYTNLGADLSLKGRRLGSCRGAQRLFKAAVRALVKGISAFEHVEQDVGAHDDRRVSVFEGQQATYMLLQSVLVEMSCTGEVGEWDQCSLTRWALGVAAEAKGRSLAYRLGAGGGGYRGGGYSVDHLHHSADPYEQVCKSWWMEVQRLARGEGAATRVVEFSFLFEDKLGIWVLSGGTGELMCSKVVSSKGLGGRRGLSIQEALAEARQSMGVQGRDDMREARDALCASTRESTELLDVSHSTREATSSVRGWATPKDLERQKVQSSRKILFELMFKVAALRDKIFIHDLMVHREGMTYRKMPSVVSWFHPHCLFQEREHMSLRKMPSLVPTLYERVKNLLQEAQIRVEESQEDKLGKEDSIEDLKKRKVLLWDSLKRLDEVKRLLEDQLCQMLLKELYQALIAPVVGALEGAEEVLIVPHKELFEVPWAALTDAYGGYLIERYVIRTAPSLRVARQAADKMNQHGNESRGHVVLVGNPLPIRTRFNRLPEAEVEAKHIMEILAAAKVVLNSEHIYFGSNPTRSPTKTHVKESLQGANWAHLACHADLGTDALVLADPSDGADQDSDLTMHEVQGSEGAQGVRLAQGATVVLSACNTARGKIKADGVVGLSRGFLLANASATVVSLWSVDDGSTAALMSIKYKHLAQGCTVPQALRLAMLRLARRPPQTRDRAAGARVCDDSESLEASQDGHQASLKEEWKQPIYWAAFLVVGATTSLRHHSPNQPA